MSRFLFGPVVDDNFHARFLSDSVNAGRWRTFTARTVSLADAVGGWDAPDALLLWMPAAAIPAWVWSIPIPVIALAAEPHLLWHSYCRLLPHADLVVCDASSAERFHRAGLDRVSAGNLSGLDRQVMAEAEHPPGRRDIDVAFLTDHNPAVQPKVLPWLGRLSELADRYSVRIAIGRGAAETRSLLRRTKLAFNLSSHGECNRRALEAAALGAVLLQEADNREVDDYLTRGSEFVPFTAESLDEVVARLLADEKEREGLADRARNRVRGYRFDTLIESAVGVGSRQWPTIVSRAQQRARHLAGLGLTDRLWLRLAHPAAESDPVLVEDLARANDQFGLAMVATSPAEAESRLAACAPRNRVAAVARAAVLNDLGRTQEAVEQLRAVLAELDAHPRLSPAERDAVPYPPRFDILRLAWERAGYDHPDNLEAESQAKVGLLRSRAHTLLAARTGDLASYRAAAEAASDLPATRAALGCALARTGQLKEAVEHLQQAVKADPLDHPAALALIAALTEIGEPTAAAAVRSVRRRLAKAAPGMVPVPEVPSPRRNEGTVHRSTADPNAHRQTRFIDLSGATFAERFGSTDARAALSSCTPPEDTRAVLTLLAAVRPRRVLEVGTSFGHMTANMTALSPPDSVVYSIGMVADSGGPHSAREQEAELPNREQFARFLNHFGTGHKAMLIEADSRIYDFARLGPLDFAFIDGGHDYDTVRSDSRGAYAALRPGGCLVWHHLPSTTPSVEVERAVANLGFSEPVYRVGGTQVAFLFKGEGETARTDPAAGRLEVNWDGEVGVVHSLAAVNRQISCELVSRGHEIVLPTGLSRAVGGAPYELPPVLIERLGRTLPDAITVRHRWPADFTPPLGTASFVLMQPWEYGRLPRAWVEPILTSVDEVWVYSGDTRRAYVASGVPEQRVAVIPLGVDLTIFHPDRPPLPLETHKAVKLLFVGGTISRKGFDCLLQAYSQAFTDRDEVCLVVKELGADSFYRGQTAGAAIERVRSQPGSPEILYLNRDLSEDDMARLYTACDALVHPYRGEGFALPVLEAMASGRPVVVTAGGPTDEFVPPAAGWRVSAMKKEFETGKVGDLETVGRPWWLEPDEEELTDILRRVVRDARDRDRRGPVARRAAAGWSWSRTAAIVEDRLRQLRGRIPVRLKHSPTASPRPPVALPSSSAVAEAIQTVTHISLPTSAVPAVVNGRPRVSLTMIVKNEERNLADCLASVRDLVDEAIVVDTGSTDRTKEIARSFGAIVGDFPWIDDFAAARNAALDLATGDYAFWMDADDRLDEENRARLKAVFRTLPGGNDAYVMKCLCVSDRPGSGTTVDHVRLFRRVPPHRWEYRIHEQILPALRMTRATVSWSGVTIRHIGYADATLRRRKLDRDIRILKLEAADRPGEPFTQFNLGSVYHEIGDYSAAIIALESSLARSHPNDSIVRKLYALLVQCHVKIGNPGKAIEVCRAGREHYPHDAELLFLAGGLARDRRDVVEAESLYRQLMEEREGDHFASVDDALRTVKGPHNLAVLLVDQNRLAEAEGVWLRGLSVDPHFLFAHIGLGDLYVRTKDAAGVAREVAAMRELGANGAVEAAALEARWLSALGNHSAGIAVLETALKWAPRAIPLRITMSHLRLADGSPQEVLEAAFRAVLEVDPANTQARHNLEVHHRTTASPSPVYPLPARARVSLTMIVRDEAANLPACLASVRDLVDDLVVVDTGSTDRTVEIAEGFGSRVVQFPWQDDFAAARNAGVEASRGDWVFWLDADECLDQTNRDKVRRLFATLKDENAAYLMRQLSPSDDPGGATTAVDQVRLFRRRPDVRWEYRIHEQILLSVRRTGANVRVTDVVISHRGYHTAAIRNQKLVRNTRLLELAHREQPDDLVLAFNLAWVYHKTERANEALSLLQRCRAELSPEYSIAPKVYRLLGQAYDRLRRPDEAQEVFTAGRKLFPDDVELLLHYGLFLQSRKSYVEAETLFRRILSLPSGNYPVGLDLGLLGYKTHNALADLYVEQKRWQEAEAEWRAALAEEPGFTLGKVGLATVALEQGRPREAADILDKLGPSDSLVLPKVERLRRRLATADRKPV
jgi:glycosyltransferase involved in cell wall biosynthesis/predicted O-methyltransferase YrrM